MEGLIGLAIFVGLATMWGAIARNMARKRGRNGTRWFWLGFVFGLLAVIVVALMGRTNENIDAMHNRTYGAFRP
jgi:hypothetical protein